MCVTPNLTLNWSLDHWRKRQSSAGKLVMILAYIHSESAYFLLFLPIYFHLYKQIYRALKGSFELWYYLRKKSVCQILIEISGVRVAVHFCTKKYSTRGALERFDCEVIRVKHIFNSSCFVCQIKLPNIMHFIRSQFGSFFSVLLTTTMISLIKPELPFCISYLGLQQWTLWQPLFSLSCALILVSQTLHSFD